MNFYNRIKMLMKHFGLTQKEFAKRIGLTEQGIIGWKKGAVPNKGTMLLIEQTFGVNPEWLRNGNGDMLQEAPLQKSEFLVHKDVVDEVLAIDPGLTAINHEDSDFVTISLEMASLPLWSSIGCVVDDLSTEEVGIITTAILEYNLYGTIPSYENERLKSAWRTIVETARNNHAPAESEMKAILPAPVENDKGEMFLKPHGFSTADQAGLEPVNQALLHKIIMDVEDTLADCGVELTSKSKADTILFFYNEFIKEIDNDDKVESIYGSMKKTIEIAIKAKNAI